MKAQLLILFIFVIKSGFSQDGSDMHYIHPNKLNSSHLGKYIHIDFYRNSFGGLNADTVHIEISEYSSFREVRNDNGFNNWFHEQFLESIQGDNVKLRIKKFKLIAIQKSQVKVKTFGYFYLNNELLPNKPLIDTLVIKTSSIHEILVSQKAPIREGLSIYRVHEDFPDFTVQPEPDCYYCLNITEDNLSEYPLIFDYQIEEFDFKNQQITLTESGRSAIEELEIPLQGLPMVLTLDGEIIYEFWFWHLHSSFGCDRVYTYPRKDFKLKFGLPEDFAFGSDPRFDERLKLYAERKTEERLEEK